MSRPPLLVLTQLPPPINGATVMNQRVTDWLSNAFDVDVIDLSLSQSVTESNTFSWKKLWKLCSIYLAVWRKASNRTRLIPNFAYFTITPTGFSFLKDALHVYILKRFGYRMIYHLHGNGIARHYSGLFRYVYDNVFRDSHVIILSESLRKDIAPLKNTIIHVLPNCVNDVSDNSVLHPSRRVGALVTIGFLSNLRRGKGIFETLALATILKTRDIPFHIIIAGPWSNDTDRKEFIDDSRFHQYQLQDHFEFLGPVSGQEKKEFFRRIDVLFFPSFIDTFPLVLLEALSHARPIICSDHGGMRDIAKPGFAYVFSHSDPNKYVRVVDELIRMQDPVYLAETSAAARDQYLKFYTHEVFRKNLNLVFQSIINRGMYL